MSNIVIEYLKEVAADFWDTLSTMSPYLLFGFLVSGILSIFLSQRLVERHLGGKGIWPVIKASLFGVPLPLCSCGVIPISMSLRKHGANRGATISFLLSTPQTGVDSILVTFSLLGLTFAIFRPLAALAIGVIGGGLVDVFDRNTENKAEPPLQNLQASPCCCEEKKIYNKILAALKHAFVALPQDIGKAMLIGLLVAAFISALVPEGFFAEKLGTGIFAMVVMMLLGIPVYVCATASVPVAAALIAKGVTPGAAMVFLMTGPATNAASFFTVWKVLGPRTAVIYLISVAGCALAAGLFLDYIIGATPQAVLSNHHEMIPSSVRLLCTVILLGVLGLAAFRSKKPVNE
jgi:uncharacterized membrane protein YraQ (UPF0718 family)